MELATYDNIEYILNYFDFDDFYNYIEKSVKKSDYLNWDLLHDYLNALLSGYVAEKYGVDIEQSNEMDDSFWQVGNDLNIWEYDHYHYLTLLVLEHSREYNNAYWFKLLDKVVGINELG